MGFLRYALACIAISTGIAAVVACSEPPGVDACRTIETERCKQAPGCGINLGTPVHRDGFDIDACIDYYQDECKHGLASGADPSGSQINACVAAIETSCDYVTSPEDAPACAFLIPPATSTDAGADSEASTTDGAADATLDGTTDTGTTN